MIKKCCICGKEFEQKRKSQVTCLDPICRKTRYKQRQAEYSKGVNSIRGVDKRTYKREKAREYRARAKGEKYAPNLGKGNAEQMPNADDYAERQKKKLLEQAGKVRTTL